MKKLLSALLLIAMLVVALASCGGGSDPEDTTPSTTTPPPTTTTPPPTTTDPWEAIATDVKAMDESLRSFKFEVSDLTEGAYHAMCTEYMGGPDSLENATATIDTLVYNRNKAAMDKLGIGTITYVPQTYAWGGAVAKMQEQTNDASNPDASDMFAFTMYDMVQACFNKGFRDLASIEGSYFDWESAGWHPTVMSDMSFDREKIYVMASDFFVELYRNFVVLPFNMTMVDGAVEELGSILLPAGQSLGTGEFLSDYLFQMVHDKKWTYDVLRQMCEKIHIDINTDGKDDFNDRVGIYLDTYGGTMAAAMLYSTTITCLTDKPGAAGTDFEGKLVPTYPETGDELNKIFLVAGNLIKAAGTTTFNSKAGAQGSASIPFAAGTGMTLGPATIAELEAEVIKNMTDVFSVVPLPLLAEGGDYNTYLHNTAALGAFNINSPRFIPMTAFIQHVTENSEEIRQEYLQVIMKFKTTQFNLGTSEMLDLVYENVRAVREMILDNVLRARKKATIFDPEKLGDPRWHGMIKSNGFNWIDNNFLDKYDTVKEAKQRGMNELMLEWYALPTAPAPAPAQ